jgi:hypothetical protein
MNGDMLNGDGRAMVCATKEMEFDSYREIKLPATTVFRDSGPLTGDVRDPWRPEKHLSDQRQAAFITTEPVTLTKAKPCVESGVRMLLGKLFGETSARVSDRRVWEIDDVLEYPPTSGRLPVEFGKLVDDISVKAELLADAGKPLVLAKDSVDEADKSAICLAEAQKVAAHEAGVTGRQTSMAVSVSINHPAVSEFSFNCGRGWMNPDISISWKKSRPGPSTVKLIMSAGGFLTGAAPEEIKRELAKCISGALKPSAGEISSREFGGVKIECQASERDGGDGSATIFRRFGADLVRDMLAPSVLSEMKRATAAQATVEDAKHRRPDLTKPLWAIEGRPICESENELSAYEQGVPSRCTRVPTDMRVISMGIGGFPWQNLNVRFIDTGNDVIEGWMASSDLRN